VRGAPSAGAFGIGAGAHCRDAVLVGDPGSRSLAFGVSRARFGEQRLRVPTASASRIIRKLCDHRKLYDHPFQTAVALGYMIGATQGR